MSRKLVVAHALLAVQILLAIGYYTWRTDRLDERFAWRMFSTVRQTQCRVDFRVGDPPKAINTYREFHENWIAIANRGRREVIEEMAAHLCRKNRDQPVTVVARCRTLDGTRDLSSGSFDLCRTGAL